MLVQGTITISDKGARQKFIEMRRKTTSFS